LKILVAGGSGFIGKRLIKSLSNRLALDESMHNEIICLSRNPEALKGKFDKEVSIVKADVSDYESLVRVMKDVDIAYYLVHSMEGSAKDWGRFAERDRIAAQNFARATTECGVKRIIYLGGLTHAKENQLSEHMRSRKEVGEILSRGSAEVTIFRAAVILGQGGGSFQMLQYLVERLPVMVCPKWVLTKCQPIAVDDVVTYLSEAAFKEETRANTFDIGGPDVLTYMDMIHSYSKMINKRVRVIVIPFLTPRLSSYWIDLVTPVRASLARPLVDSLVHDATVTDDDESIKTIIPLNLKSFQNAIRDSLSEKDKEKEERTTNTEWNAIGKKERTSREINNRILAVSLYVMAIFGLTYYLISPRQEIFQPQWLVLGALWYVGIAFAIYFVRYGTRLGALVAGILGWTTLVFWLLDYNYVVFGSSAIASTPDQLMMMRMTARNFLGAIVASVVIVSSHRMFHKLSE
jgi:uncharacterized protein YbjT (DUF2867 family)